MINWFDNVKNKQKCTFICFDVCNFYPSISQDLLINALHFASQYDEITDDEINIIKHSKQSMLFNKGSTWCKRGNSLFDVTMGSYDGAETCELIGLYLLSQLNHLNINIGLYRDDGLAVSHKTPRQTDLLKKEICSIFSKNGLNITIEANKTTVDFLDITLDLPSATYRPFMKPNNSPLYVHKDSNHPPSIINNIPESINKRLSNISSNEELFNNAAPPYQDALRKSGYNYELKYNPQRSNNNKRKRTRNIVWFNPPYSDNVATNIGRKFFNLLDRCFPPGHQLHKLINRNTVKLSYSCMPNMKNIITKHNKSVIGKSEPTQTDKSQKDCNCRDKLQCPLNKKCQTSSVIYQATVTREDNNNSETYIGLTENSFKSRYAGHLSSFKHETKRNATALSEHIWTLKDKNINFSLKWKIVSKAKSYSTSSKKCNLCTEEKYFIIYRPDLCSLNKRNELLNSCRHRKKHLLCNIKP